MRLGASLRFLYPTGPATYPIFRSMLDALPAGGFIERPIGSFDTAQQARRVVEIAALAREAGLGGLLYGDNHAVPAVYANSFSQIPTIGRIMAVTGEMPVGVVILAPFYEPIVLAEQLGTLAAFAESKRNADAFVAAGAAEGAGPGGDHEDGKFHEMLKPYEAKNDSTAESEYRWGMTIDLDSCSGCSACVVACAIENNIPNVGEEGMLRNRGMQWLRIERYVGDGDQELIVGRKPTYNHEKPEDTDVRHSPMLFQQCGAAPGEPVCPVLATYHNEEGLNGMIYNRCIGTRYCSNNCPYKVRRYNWFDYAIERLPEPSRLMLNPDVTVRSQGVMEKCTFCIQRVQGARQLAKDEFRPIADGEVTPACAQSCPSQAITFGNLKDDKSEVVKRADENRGRAYHALQVLNTRPGITYLAKLLRDEEKHG